MTKILLNSLGILLLATVIPEATPALAAVPSSIKHLCPQSMDASSASRDDCWRTIANSPKDFDALLALVAQGDPPSANYLAPRIRELDGGNLEDALVALGQFSEWHTKEFLELAARRSVSVEELMRALTMLPASFTDNRPMQLAKIKERRSKLELVATPGLTKYRRISISAVNEFISEIKRSAAAARSQSNSKGQ